MKLKSLIVNYVLVPSLAYAVVSKAMKYLNTDPKPRNT